MAKHGPSGRGLEVRLANALAHHGPAHHSRADRVAALVTEIQSAADSQPEVESDGDSEAGRPAEDPGPDRVS